MSAHTGPPGSGRGGPLPRETASTAQNAAAAKKPQVLPESRANERQDRARRALTERPAVCAGLARRRTAAWRVPPLPGRRGLALADRDPLLSCSEPRRPSTFGLSDEELWREVRRLQAAGWADWEVIAVLAHPKKACQP